MRQTIIVKPSVETKIEPAEKIQFHGQQSDERVLYRAKQSVRMMYLQFFFIVVSAIFFIVIFQFLVGITGSLLVDFQNLVLIAVLLTIAIILWWIHRIYAITEIFITDRRVVKFLPVVPYRKTMRSLFWDEAIKAKTYYKNIVLEKILGIGSVEVHGRNHERDNVGMDYLEYHEDLGNYIDKILYIYKNQPSATKDLRKFVPKPTGKRY